MNVRDLLEEIGQCRSEYGEEFLEWDVFTEQIDELDKESKRNRVESTGRKWGRLGDSEGWEYFECAGFWTKFPKEKAFSVNVNY